MSIKNGSKIAACLRVAAGVLVSPSRQPHFNRGLTHETLIVESKTSSSETSSWQLAAACQQEGAKTAAANTFLWVASSAQSTAQHRQQQAQHGVQAAAINDHTKDGCWLSMARVACADHQLVGRWVGGSAACTAPPVRPTAVGELASVPAAAAATAEELLA